MIRILDKFFSLIYPQNKYCQVCQRELSSFELELGLCAICLNQFSLREGELPLVKTFADGKQYFDLALSTVIYTGLMKEIIHRWKYHGERSLVYPLVELMYRHWPLGLQRINWDGLIPVPMHQSRLLKRGYNQAMLLASGLAFYLNLPYLEVVKRVKKTLPQNQLTFKEREKNLTEAFQLHECFQINRKNWLIIDDILTTGLTVNQIARILKIAGARTIGVYTLAAGKLSLTFSTD